MTYKPHLVEHTLYRGQTRDYGVVLASGWRDFRTARQALFTEVLPLAERYLEGGVDQTTFETELSTIASTAKKAPSLHRFLQEGIGRRLVIDLLDHIRDSFSPALQRRIFRAQLAELETAFLRRYQSYLFNDSWDQFMKANVGETLGRLAQLLMEFYDARRDAFDVEYRVVQVAVDFMGVLQQYGAVDTPGLDLTSDLDVALWFATNRYDYKKDEYYALPPDEWGWVYEAEFPVIEWTDADDADGLQRLPDVQVVSLCTLSSLFVRIWRQQGYYAIYGAGWDRIVDYREVFQMRKKAALDYDSAEAIQRRLSAKGLTREFLFPSPKVDSFKAHLSDHKIHTFL